MTFPSTYRFTLENNPCFILLEDGSYLLQEESEDSLNTLAGTQDHSGYSVCEKSGRKAYPGELVKDPYSGLMVLKKYVDNQFEERAYRSTHRNGVEMAEQDDRFLTDNEIQASDL